MNKEEWKNIYNEDFKRMDSLIPEFSDRIKRHIPERFNFFARYFNDGDKVLDCGCFDGYPIWCYNKLSDGKNIKFSGFDVSPNAVKRCEENLNCLDYFDGCKEGFIEESPYEDDTFDVVIASEVIEHLESPLVGLKEMYRVLKEGGKLIISVPKEKNLRDRLHLHFFNYYDIMDLFDTFGDEYKIFTWGKFYESENNIFIIVLEKGNKRGEDDGK